jgi:hypothetical protein
MSSRRKRVAVKEESGAGDEEDGGPPAKVKPTGKSVRAKIEEKLAKHSKNRRVYDFFVSWRSRCSVIVLFLSSVHRVGYEEGRCAS